MLPPAMQPGRLHHKAGTAAPQAQNGHSQCWGKNRSYKGRPIEAGSVMAAIVGLVCEMYLLAAAPAASVELEIFVVRRAPITAAQDWLRELAAAGLTRVRIRAKQESDQVGIETLGLETQPAYRVLGTINMHNELVLPGGRYRLGEARQAVRWLEEVAHKGPGHKAGAEEERGPGGLSGEPLRELKKALARPVGAATKDKDRAEVLKQVAGQVGVALRAGGALGEGLAGHTVAEELQGLSSGTALAYLLRSAGLCMVPSARGGGGWEFSVRPLAEGQACWPVGWAPDASAVELLPSLFESFNANLQNVSVAQAMEAIGKRLKAPVLWDHRAIVRHGIDPAKVLITLPRMRTTHHGLMRRVLAKADLRYEVRVDDAGRPFVWATTVKPF